MDYWTSSFIRADYRHGSEVIMPVDMSKYPDNWDSEIRPSILRRAGGNENDPRVGAKCEWCGVQNYAVGYRDEDGDFKQLVGNVYLDSVDYADSYSSARELADHHNDWNAIEEKYIVIVLTIAHLDDPDPMNCDPSNLAALCQKCHNDYDLPMRRKNAQATKIQRMKDAGQLELIEVTS